MKPDAVQLRVLGALLEKQRTTPDAYPLTLNALRAACNQTTNRDPVVQYDDAQIRHALEELGRRRWTRSAGGTRAAKYRHLLNDTLGLAPEEQAVLAVLLLRGPQTPAELRARTERLHRFESGDAVESVIDRLVTRQLVVRLERRPGQKEGRVQQIMGGEELQTTQAATSGTTEIDRATTVMEHASTHPGAVGGLDAEALTGRVGQLEGDVEALREELAAVREELAALRSELGA